jgi:hypothetical protein
MNILTVGGWVGCGGVSKPPDQNICKVSALKTSMEIKLLCLSRVKVVQQPANTSVYQQTQTHTVSRRDKQDTVWNINSL